MTTCAAGASRPGPGCGTLLHAECAAGLVGCPTLGCARRQRPAGPAKRGFWSLRRLACAVIAVVALLVVGAAAAMDEWMASNRPIWERKKARAHLQQRLGVDVPTVAQEARGLHARLAPTEERPVTAAELADCPHLRDAAQGGVVAWEGGLIVYIDKESYMSWAVVVLARPEATLSPPMRRWLELRHPDLLERLEELEPGVYVRTVTR